MSEPSIRVLSHLGICVSDAERSKRFYCEGLGFRLVTQFTAGNDFGTMMELEGEVDLDSIFLRRDGFSIELLGYRSPKPKGDGKRRPMDQLGLTHLSLVVDDVDAIAQRVVAYGGSIVKGTRIETPGGEFVFCLDPDGVRLELMRLVAGPVPTGD